MRVTIRVRLKADMRPEPSRPSSHYSCFSSSNYGVES